MSRENNRIYFTNSPFKNGHKIVEFTWRMHLDEHLKLWMDLHLESDNYDEEEEYQDDADLIEDTSEEYSDKSLWINFNQCILSSFYWNNKGIDLNTKQEKLDFDDLPAQLFHIDPLPIDFKHPENLAFGIAMLGNDTCADHEISFLKPFDNDELGVYDIKWKGKVANTHFGEQSFDYEFYVYMKSIRFAGVHIDASLDKDKAFAFIQERFVQGDEFELVSLDEINETYRAVLKREIL